jgi:hypothetical protein
LNLYLSRLRIILLTTVVIVLTHFDGDTLPVSIQHMVHASLMVIQAPHYKVLGTAFYLCSLRLCLETVFAIVVKKVPVL